jgi:DNA-binding transcriptional regulator GbsR (MarR family)
MEKLKEIYNKLSENTKLMLAYGILNSEEINISELSKEEITKLIEMAHNEIVKGNGV